jgi:DNA-binding GntR family transcriptional regulator
MEGIFMSGKLKQYELEIRNIRKKIKLIKLGKRHALWILKNSKNEPLKLVIHLVSTRPKKPAQYATNWLRGVTFPI